MLFIYFFSLETRLFKTTVPKNICEEEEGIIYVCVHVDTIKMPAVIHLDSSSH